MAEALSQGRKLLCSVLMQPALLHFVRYPDEECWRQLSWLCKGRHKCVDKIWNWLDAELICTFWVGWQCAEPYFHWNKKWQVLSRLAGNNRDNLRICCEDEPYDNHLDTLDASRYGPEYA